MLTPWWKRVITVILYGMVTITNSNVNSNWGCRQQHWIDFIQYLSMRITFQNMLSIDYRDQQQQECICL